MRDLAASHQFLEHTSEIRLRVRAGDLAGIIAETGRALAELELGHTPPPPSGPSRTLEVRSADRSALLVDWLNELIFLAEAEQWVPVQFDVTQADDTFVRVEVGGVEVEQPPTLVKAATLHGIRVEPVAGGMEADVILDI